MARLTGKLVRALVYTAATVVIVLALVIGLIRLLLPQLPQYQQEVRDAAAAATGLDVRFARLSASWPLRGPELVLYDVTVADPNTTVVIARAREVSVGVDVLQLLLDRRIVPSAIGLNGSELRVERLADGGFALQGRSLADWLPSAGARQSAEAPRLRLRLEDIELTYTDPAAAAAPLQARLRRLELRLRANRLVGEGLLELGGGQTGRVELSADGRGRILGPDADPLAADWQLVLGAEELAIPPLLELGLGLRTPLAAASGSLSLAASLSGGRPQALLADVDLRGVEFRDDDGPIDGLELLAGRVEWAAEGPGWLFAITDLRLGRAGRLWPRADVTVNCRATGEAGERQCEGGASFLRLDDAYAVVRGFASAPARRGLFPEELRGEVRDLRFSLGQAADEAPRFSLSLGFDEAGLINLPGGITVSGLTGELEADESGGRLELDSGATEWRLPAIFEDVIATDTLEGLLVWRLTDDGLRVISDSVDVTAPDVVASSRFELSVPRDGSSPVLDLDARAQSASAPGVLDYLPLQRFPPPVSRWLRRAIVGGRVEQGSIRVRGPLRAFPFERGEGLFRVDLTVVDGILDFADRWPRLEGLDADFVFDGVSLYSTRNAGRFAGIEVADQEVRFDDLRNGRLVIGIEQPTAVQPLRDLLLATPVADNLGAVLQRVTGQGDIDARLELLLPVTRPQDYRLEARFDARDCELGFEGLAFQLDDIRGTVELQNTRLSADRLDAVLLGEPVTVQLGPAGAESRGHSHFARLDGRTPLRRWLETLDLPQPDRFTGLADWRALVMIPGAGPEGDSLKVMLDGDLTGVESRLPAPLAKRAGEAARFDLQLDFAGSVLNVGGQFRDDIAWAFRLESGPQGWEVERGAVHSGYGPALLPVLPGVELSGRLARLRLSDWLELADGETAGRWLSLYREAAFSIDELVIFGQRFPDAEVLATRQPGVWRVALDAPWALGNLVVPDVPATRRPLRLDMDRLWLLEAEQMAAGEPEEVSDPRLLPPVAVDVADFRIGALQFGRLDARVEPTEEGVLLSPIQAESASFTLTGDGAWLVLDGDLARQRTRLRGELRSTDVKATLLSLGYQPLLEGESARVTADVNWPGPPAADFLAGASGQVQMRLKDGALLEVEPGSGRVLGMLSVAALPRRLALDFRDVFDEGLSFSTLEGDFTLEAGEAYTCNLGLQGAVADLGIVGRTSIREENYDQLAVVRPHVSNVLALGGAVVGGPGVGAAMLLISRIFRKPLSQIGESYYQIQGSWATPSIDKIQRIDVDTTRFSDCEALLPAVMPEAVLVPLPQAAPEAAGPAGEDSGTTPGEEAVADPAIVSP